MIRIDGLDKALVLKALYDNARVPASTSFGWLHYRSGPLPIEDARRLVGVGLDFEYVQGRVIKVNLSGDSFDPFCYDRNNGEGAAQKAIQTIIKLPPNECK